MNMPVDPDYEEALFQGASLVPPKNEPVLAADYTRVPCRILRDTDKAILLLLEKPADSYWFPISYIDYIKRTPKTDTDFMEYNDVVHVATWLLVKKGITL